MVRGLVGVETRSRPSRPRGKSECGPYVSILGRSTRRVEFQSLWSGPVTVEGCQYHYCSNLRTSTVPPCPDVGSGIVVRIQTSGVSHHDLSHLFTRKRDRHEKWHVETRSGGSRLPSLASPNLYVDRSGVRKDEGDDTVRRRTDPRNSSLSTLDKS